MKTKLFLLILFVTFSLSGQEDISKLSQEFITNNNYLNNIEQEKFYLHTNKTTYYAGEKIWFKAYVVEDSSNKPNYATSNLFINFYSPEKKLISSKLYYVFNGATHGEIDLNGDLVSGSYYIEIDTQKNKNFKNGTVVPIIVINSESDQIQTSNISSSENINPLKETDNYTMSFFPESKTLLKNENNNLAFSIKNNDIPIKTIGKIIDNATGKKVTNFMSDAYGMGRINIDFKSTYTAVLNRNGAEESFKLPEAKDHGIIISKSPLSNNNNAITVVLKTNQATKNLYKNETLFLVLHRNGIVKSVAPIELNLETNTYSINFLNEDLFSGLNTLTLFNKNNSPISEFSFWNNINAINLEINKTVTTKDSISLNFNVLNNKSTANLSISVLPEATISYNNNYNIITEFLLAPYLKETTFSLADYYNKTNGNKHSLDLLIQVFNKSSLKYNNKQNEENLVFKPEHGIKIKGAVNFNNKDLSKHQVMLSSTENDILLIEPLNGGSKFEFDSLMLVHPSKYKLALLNEKGEIEKAGFFVYKDYNKYRPDSTLSKQVITFEKINLNPTNNQQYNYTPKLMNEEVLDEVLLTSRAKENKEILEKRVEEKIRAKGFTQAYIPDEKTFAGADLLFYLKTLNGIQVNYFNASSVSVINTRGAKSILGGQHPYLIFLDGVPMQDHSELIGIQMFDVASVTVNSSGAGYGIQGTGGVIHIYTKTADLMKGITEIINPNIFVSDTEFGFNLPTEPFKNSEIYYPNKTSEELYSSIDWIPNYYVNPNQPNVLTIDARKHNSIKLFINGMNAEGQLIYKSVTINKESN